MTVKYTWQFVRASRKTLKIPFQVQAEWQKCKRRQRRRRRWRRRQQEEWHKNGMGWFAFTIPDIFSMFLSVKQWTRPPPSSSSSSQQQQQQQLQLNWILITSQNWSFHAQFTIYNWQRNREGFQFLIIIFQICICRECNSVQTMANHQQDNSEHPC